MSRVKIYLGKPPVCPQCGQRGWVITHPTLSIRDIEADDSLTTVPGELVCMNCGKDVIAELTVNRIPR